MRSTIFSLAAVVAVVLAVSSHAAEQSRFSSVIDDLPLMDQMVEADDGMTFTTPAGRIANVEATTTLSRKEVLDFYAATLPQLGWTKTAAATFVREGEMLNVTFEQTGSAMTVRFAILPSKN
ncbi:hypothetical protein [Magnetovibrio sp.]|uniref:hypothetical protein n=1 Tax=Magnetovibrio sp. TaxID=2024836 RepID=UPI002F92DB68